MVPIHYIKIQQEGVIQQLGIIHYKIIQQGLEIQQMDFIH
jgi:hypothetical protein